MNNEQPVSPPVIPTLAIYTCNSCGKQAVAQEGATILCETCVNAFLAKNVGLMKEEVPPEEK